jgi:hypothetical protein
MELGHWLDPTLKLLKCRIIDHTVLHSYHASARAQGQLLASVQVFDKDSNTIAAFQHPLPHTSQL